MYIKFWGVRGSIPVPGEDTFRFGGNTTCVEIRSSADDLIILDAGTGIRELGLDLMKRGFCKGNKTASIFFTHTHWDHIQGFPFFPPVYVGQKGCTSMCKENHSNIFDLYGIFSDDKNLEKILRGQMDNSYFPIDLDYLPTKLTFNSLDKPVKIGSITITATQLKHPNGVFGYRIQEGAKSFVFATDCEHPDDGSIDKNLLALAKDTDILVYDGQYTDEEYDPKKFGKDMPSKKGFGHSTPTEGVKVAKATNAKQLIITHHDPLRTDDQIDVLQEEIQKLLPNSLFAYEGLKIEL